MRLICRLGVHKWKYKKEKTERRCGHCNDVEIKVYVMGESLWITKYGRRSEN